MTRSELIDLWIQHCKEHGHVTRAQALEMGMTYSPKRHAAFTFGITGKRIYCRLAKCRWQAE